MLGGSFSSILARVRAPLASFVVVLVAGLPAAAAAQGRVPVAVLPFGGPGGTAARRTAIAALENEPRVTVTDEGIADAAAARAGATASGATGVDAFARQLQVRVVIQGTLGGRARSRQLSLTARDAHGAGIATQTVRIRGGAAGRRAIEGALRSLLDTALASLPPERPPVVATAAQEEGPPPIEDGPPYEPLPTRPFGEDPAILTLLVMGGARSRDMSIRLDDGTTRSYEVSPYFDLAGRAELRPLAHEQNYARGLYVVAEAGGAIALSSRAPGATSMVSTNYYRIAGSVGYLVPIVDVLEVGVGVGGGYDAFELGDNTALPTVAYPYLRPAARVRVRAIGEALVIGAEGGYRALFSRDGLSSSFGPNGSSFGWDIGGTVSGMFDIGLSYWVEGGFTQYVHQFDLGPGTLGQGNHGADGGYRFLVGLGYSVR
jgi:hypothetical protein